MSFEETSGRLFTRTEITELIRNKLILNLNLATNKAIKEGIQVLKKYNDLDFYLENIAFGQIHEYKAI